MPSRLLRLSFVGFALMTAACVAPAEEDAETAVGSVTSRHARPLVARGRNFVDRQGRTVILRGVNVAGNSKVPPFLPYDDPRSLDVLQRFGMNVVRMPFIWEAYEPRRGAYDAAYLHAMIDVARAAWARGLYVLVDFHQDGFSRHAIGGCGAGFPVWSLPPNVKPSTPDNGARCANWALRMFTTPSMHSAWNAFHRDEHGARTAFLEMTARVAKAFAPIEGVIGYDLLNEPWGFDDELVSLYRDEAAAIRAEDPEAILFVEGHISTNSGLGTTMARPSFDNFAYAPHYYDPVTMIRKAYDANPSGIDHAFDTMEAQAKKWSCPLFVGEYGMFAGYGRVAEYVTQEYEGLDRVLASGAQWNLSPRWTEEAKDGWNAEDLAIIDPDTAELRDNFAVRPFPRATSGTPVSLSVKEAGGQVTFEYHWRHDGHAATEISLPSILLEAGSPEVEATGVRCARKDGVLACSGEAADAVVRIDLAATSR